MIIITNARCGKCGMLLKIEDPNATGTAFIDARYPSRPELKTCCKNAMLCDERARETSQR